MHQLEYQKAYSKETVTKELHRFFETSDKPKILEIFTPSVENDLVLKDYFKYIQ
jgi:2-succinyl-5-enolpyruvyl-6-hydroxy-3-cyclohexene-1-carboxylate synthase